MRFRRAIAALALGAVVVAACSGGGPEGPAPTSVARSTAVTPAPSASTTTVTGEGLTLDLRGLGPVRVGMTVAAAAEALGQALEPVTAPTDDCTLYAPARGFDGLAFLVARGTVARADVIAGATVTREGMAIGQSEDEAQRRYEGRLVVSPHDFQLGGHYLTLIPADPADGGFRLVAETDGTTVTSMRAGRLPEVDFTEGCS